MAFRVLAAENFPQHRTIFEFRRRHPEDLERMFVEVVGLACEMRGAVGAAVGRRHEGGREREQA